MFISLLQELKGKLNKSQLKQRLIAFQKAEAWVQKAAATKVGLPPGQSYSFTSPSVPGSVARVDIEILRGPVNIIPYF